jgi:hypothetical protein
MMSLPFTFIDLPDDVILLLMRYLTPDDVLSMSLVNKRVNRLSYDNNLWCVGWNLCRSTGLIVSYLNRFHMFLQRFGKTAALAKIREYELREEQRKNQDQTAALLVAQSETAAAAAVEPSA